MAGSFATRAKCASGSSQARLDPGRDDRSGARPRRGGSRPSDAGCQALLVVQPGFRGRVLRDAEAPLRRRWKQGLRNHRHARWIVRKARTVAGTLSVPHILGTEGGAAMHRMDRAVRGPSLPQPPPRSHARLPAASGLRPSAIRSVRVRHGSPDRRARPSLRRRSSMPRLPTELASGSYPSTATPT